MLLKKNTNSLVALIAVFTSISVLADHPTKLPDELHRSGGKILAPLKVDYVVKPVFSATGHAFDVEVTVQAGLDVTALESHWRCSKGVECEATKVLTHTKTDQTQDFSQSFRVAAEHDGQYNLHFNLTGMLASQSLFQAVLIPLQVGNAIQAKAEPDTDEQGEPIVRLPVQRLSVQ